MMAAPALLLVPAARGRGARARADHSRGRAAFTPGAPSGVHLAPPSRRAPPCRLAPPSRLVPPSRRAPSGVRPSAAPGGPSAASTALVRDMMRKDPVHLKCSTSLGEASTVMQQERISGAPVLGDADDVVGVVSESDILRACSELFHHGGRIRHNLPIYAPQMFELLSLDLSDEELSSMRGRAMEVMARPVSDVMSAPPIVVGDDELVVEALEVMLNQRVNRLPVVEGPYLVGIITRSDILSWMSTLAPPGEANFQGSTFGDF